MRFAMVTTFYPPFSYGGDATYVRALARGLVARGHDVEVVASTDAYALRSPMPPDAPHDGADGVVVHRLQSRTPRLAPLVVQQTARPGLYASELGRILERGFDVIHYHNISLVGGLGVLNMGAANLRLYSLHEHWLFCPAHILWKNAARRCDRPACFSCSIRSGIPPQLWRYTTARARALAGIDRIFAPSKFTAERHYAAGITKPIAVLPLFSALPVDSDASIAPLARPLFLFVGRVTASKGIARFLSVAARLPEFDFLVTGEGDLRAALEQAHQGRPHIRFAGHLPQPEVAAHYASATALVLPSLSPETFGLAVVEAAQFGTPAIVDAGAGGAAEIVREGGGGLLYENESGLVVALRAIAGNADLRSRLGAAARDAYATRYTPDLHFRTYMAHLDSLLAGKREAEAAACAR